MHFGLCVLVFALPLIFSCSSSRYETRTDPHLAVASWYGTEFHGRQTASGERYDMHALTCAHRDFPFGTQIKVTNVARGKSVSCVVNDRGPFVSGRDLDLSYAAAREIDLIGSGTGSVRIEYLGRDLRYVKEVRHVSSAGPYTIQVGSFKEPDNARHLKAGLELKYAGVYITEAFVKGATYYRVRIGKFSGKEKALRLASMLAEEGYSPVIMRHDERA